jgi:hypothetical protein
MRRELRSLRKMTDSKVNTELKAISKEIKESNIEDNLISFLKNDFKNQMSENLNEIQHTEIQIDKERAALKELTN